MIKKMIILFCLINAHFAIAQENTLQACAPQKPLLVLDEDLGRELPRNFRSTYKNKDKWLSKLNIAASAQFSENTLNNARSKMGAKIIIVDLRAESHGYINGMPVSWYGHKNSHNKGKNIFEILAREHKKLAALQKLSVIEMHDFDIDDHGCVYSTSQSEVKPIKVETEQELAHRLGFGYERFFILDHHYPPVEEVEHFIDFVKRTPKDTWLLFHCRGGKGRSTSFMVMYDIMRSVESGKKFKMDEFIARQVALGGIDLSRLKKDMQATWRDEHRHARYGFIEDFYTYMMDDKHGYKAGNSWSLWLSYYQN